MNMKVAVLFSGGKDSTMAAYSAIKEGHELKYLVSVFSDNPASYMFHVANIHITELSAEAMGIPLIKKVTKGIKEEELDDLKNILIELKDSGIEAIYSGALFSVYQKSRIDAICEELGLKSCAPLWHRDPVEYMNEIIDLGFEVIITSVAAEGLDESWLGKKIDKDVLDEIVELNKKYKIHFKLSKQAAFVGVPNFVEDDLSPLGEIDVEIETDDTQRFIDWIAPEIK